MVWIWFRAKDYGISEPLLCLESLLPAQLAEYVGLGSTSKHIKGEPRGLPHVTYPHNAAVGRYLVLCFYTTLFVRIFPEV